jgi:hypothetical protein
MGPWIIPFFAASVDRLYWAIYKRRDMVVPPKGGGPVGAWIQAFVSGIGGAAGAFAISRLTGQSDLFTLIVGAFIGGRLVGGIIDTVATPSK